MSSQLIDVIAPVSTYMNICNFVPTVLKAVKTGSPSAFSESLLLISFLNQIVWFSYGIQTWTMSILTSNTIGVIVNVIYVAIFYRLSKAPLRLGGVLAAGAALTLFFCTTTLTILDLCALIISLIAAVAPLELVLKAFKSKDSGCIEPISLLLGLFCSGSWFVFGRVHQNMTVIIPNGIGHIILWAVALAYLAFAKGPKPAVKRE
eukprot:TRINITY_DN0_c812_g1_i2.p1 TRINITY_DN0_c812_g1~~TRINITY_DN0_c812_g1_i2.p1  ORF type:complete len:205 (-),score=40.11 TRINITY_DN0_c812_g1_i2:57-671(-)